MGRGLASGLQQVFGFLAVQSAQKIQGEVVVHVAHGRRLGSTVGPQRGHGHDAMLVQNRQNLVPDVVVHGLPPQKSAGKWPDILG